MAGSLGRRFLGRASLLFNRVSGPRLLLPFLSAIKAFMEASSSVYPRSLLLDPWCSGMSSRALYLPLSRDEDGPSGDRASLEVGISIRPTSCSSALKVFSAIAEQEALGDEEDGTDSPDLGGDES